MLKRRDVELVLLQNGFSEAAEYEHPLSYPGCAGWIPTNIVGWMPNDSTDIGVPQGSLLVSDSDTGPVIGIHCHPKSRTDREAKPVAFVHLDQECIQLPGNAHKRLPLHRLATIVKQGALHVSMPRPEPD
jgi:hypothetical protein